LNAAQGVYPRSGHHFQQSLAVPAGVFDAFLMKSVTVLLQPPYQEPSV
jgi:hypothetical protein